MSQPKTRGASKRACGKPDAPDWKRDFHAALAETSNVARAARAVGKDTSTVYETRRKSRDFAAKWQSALCEGYGNLEIELLGRLREGEIKRAASAKTGVRTFDNATAYRLLTVHRDSVAREKALRGNVSAAEIRASIERKVASLKQQVLAREEEERLQLEAQGGAADGE